MLLAGACLALHVAWVGTPHARTAPRLQRSQPVSLHSAPASTHRAHPAPSAAADALRSLDGALSSFCAGHGSASTREAEAVMDACLAVCRLLPGVDPSIVPSGAGALAEAAAFFPWQSGGQLGQHLFDASLCDDTLAALALAVSTPDVPPSFRSASILSRSCLVSAASALAASARFIALPASRRAAAIDLLEAAVLSPRFLAARRAALGVARHRRITRPRAVTVDASDAALPAQDEDIISTLYEVCAQQLGGNVLQPLGFPATKLGIRCLVGAERATGSPRAAAVFGRIWHASDGAAPLILARAAVPDTEGGLSRSQPADTVGGQPRVLVIAFSSLGWFGVVRAEWGATLRAAAQEAGAVEGATEAGGAGAAWGDVAPSWRAPQPFDVLHALDTSQSWWCTNPVNGDWDGGRWWDASLAQAASKYEHVCLLGESMGGTAALRFAHLARGRVCALVPQIDVRDFGFACREDFTPERATELVAAVRASVAGAAAAAVVVRVGGDAADCKQLGYLGDLTADVGYLGGEERGGRGTGACGVGGGAGAATGRPVRVVRHAVTGHALGMGLKQRGGLQRVVLGDLFGE